MSLVKKEVRYLNKDFAQFRQNLINFTKTYFPDTYGDFNETSPGMMFMEMASYVGDVLSFYTDTAFRETMLTSAQERRNVMELSHLYGYKPRNRTPATCMLSVYHLVSSIGSGATIEPDMRQALSIAAGMIVRSENGIEFRTTEPIDFAVDPEITVYDLDSNGDPVNYLLKKTVQVVSGTVQTQTFQFNDPKPYEKIVLPEADVVDIISIYDSSNNRWRQVDFLAQDTVFEDVLNVPFNDPQLSQFASSVPYILKLRRTPRRFIARLRDDDRMEIQFGSGISSNADEEIIPNPKNVGLGLEYLRRETMNNLDPSNFLYTSTYGLAPNNTTLTVTYSTGGGLGDNQAVNTINQIVSFNVLNESYGTLNFDLIQETLAVTNEEPATGGNDFTDLEHIRQNAMASFAAQNRAITREDYISRIYAMPARFGAVEKAFVIGDSQIDTRTTAYPSYTIQNPLALNVYILAYDENRNFTAANQALKENLRTYLSEYRMLTDALNIKDAFIINIAMDFEITVRPTYSNAETILKCIERLKFLMSNERMQINGSIDINALKADLDRIEGVQTVNDLSVRNVYSTAQGYSGNVYDINTATKNGIVYPSLDPCIFEIKYPNSDIKGRSIGD